MPHCTFTFSANTGGALALGPFRVWYDALHQEKLPGFSTLSPALLAEMGRNPAFAAPDVIFHSHCHPDHFSRSLLATARQQWPQAEIFLPEKVFPDQVPLEGTAMSASVGGLTLHFHRLPHESTQYIHVPHYGCLLEWQGYRVLLTGDCTVGCSALAELTGGKGVDLALLDFPWLTLPRGREAIADLIRPRHLLIGHLPFPQDDRWGYRLAAQRALGKLPAVADIRLLLEPFQTEFFD